MIAETPVSREEAIRRLFPLVRRLARRVHRVLPAADLDDLVGDGSIGLIRAVDTFDAGRGSTLEGYATRVVVGAMLNGLRRLDPISERVRRTMREADRVRYDRAQQDGRLPPLGELETELPALRRARAVVHAYVPLSLDGPLPNDCRVLPDASSDPAERSANASLARALRREVRALPERQRRVLALHYFREVPLHTIGRSLSVSPQRVSQLHLRALARLRTAPALA